MSSPTHAPGTSGHFSNTRISKTADPYKPANTDKEIVSSKEKIEGLMAFAEGVKFGMMTTRQNESGLLVSRCMALAAKENGVDLIFYTNTETHKTDELMADSHVNVTFIKSGSGEWASISGTATIETEREKVKCYYSPGLKAWIGDLGDGVHDGGPEDPRIGIIKVKAISATYALNKGNVVSRGIEVAKGMVSGSTASVNKLREITSEEFSQYRGVN